jgi:hypothetical protein
MEVHEARTGSDRLDPNEYSRMIRQFAIDARRILSRPDSTTVELFGLQRRAGILLRGSPVRDSGGINRWLSRMRQSIGDRLRALTAAESEARLQEVDGSTTTVLALTTAACVASGRP